MPTLALDIGNYAIKAISGKPGQKATIEKVAEVFNTAGFAVPTDDASFEKLGSVIESAISDYSLPVTDVRIALPESIISSKVIEIPPLSDAELASAIGWQAEKHIPIPPEDLSLEYQVLYRPPKGDTSNMRVLLVAARKQVIDSYVEMFRMLGIEPSLLEPQSIALMRALQFDGSDPNTLVVNIGFSTMDLVMVRNGELNFVTSNMSGGQLFTRALEQGVGLDTNQAEQYKRGYGLDESQFQGKLRQALEPAVKLLVDEIRKSVQFFINQYPQETVQRVVLSGGSAALLGLVQFVTEQLGTEVLVVTPFAGIESSIPENINQPGMAIAMGLLMRDL